MGQGDAAEQLLALYDEEGSGGLHVNNAARPATYSGSGPASNKSALRKAPDR
jgi:hypothetical protein